MTKKKKNQNEKKEVVRELNDIIDSITKMDNLFARSPLSALGYIVARFDDLIDDIEER